MRVLRLAYYVYQEVGMVPIQRLPSQVILATGQHQQLDNTCFYFIHSTD